MSFEGLINADEVHQCFSQAGFTIQFYSPQRFSHPLWYLLESCERKFNCLSGASRLICGIHTSFVTVLLRVLKERVRI
jgi:hypothetical protein